MRATVNIHTGYDTGIFHSITGIRFNLPTNWTAEVTRERITSNYTAEVQFRYMNQGYRYLGRVHRIFSEGPY